jgi:hypothetical protein
MAHADWLLRDINNGLDYLHVLERARRIVSLQLLDEFGSTGEDAPRPPLTYDPDDPRTYDIAWQNRLHTYETARRVRGDRLYAVERMGVDELCAWLEDLIAPSVTAHAAD